MLFVRLRNNASINNCNININNCNTYINNCNIISPPWFKLFVVLKGFLEYFFNWEKSLKKSILCPLESSSISNSIPPQQYEGWGRNCRKKTMPKTLRGLWVGVWGVATRLEVWECSSKCPLGQARLVYVWYWLVLATSSFVISTRGRNETQSAFLKYFLCLHPSQVDKSE